jgi:hypothetical protein
MALAKRGNLFIEPRRVVKKRIARALLGQYLIVRVALKKYIIFYPIFVL